MSPPNDKKNVIPAISWRESKYLYGKSTYLYGLSRAHKKRNGSPTEKIGDDRGGKKSGMTEVGKPME